MNNSRKFSEKNRFASPRIQEKLKIGSDSAQMLNRIALNDSTGGKRREFTDCPKCGSKQTDVVDSRKNLEHLRRRRKCSDCDYRWTSYEVTEADFKKLKNSADENKLHQFLKNYFHSLTEPERSKLIDEFYS